MNIPLETTLDELSAPPLRHMLILIDVAGQPYATAHTVDAAGTILLSFRQLPPVHLTISWPEADWSVEVHPTHPDEPHHRGHNFRSRIIEVWKELLTVNRGLGR